MFNKASFGIEIEKELRDIKNIQFSDLRRRAIKMSMKSDPSDAIEYFRKFLSNKLPDKHTLSSEMTHDNTFVTWAYSIDDDIAVDGHTLQVMDIKKFHVIRLYVESISDDYELSVEQLKILVRITETYWYEAGRKEITKKIKEFNEIFNPTTAREYFPY